MNTNQNEHIHEICEWPALRHTPPHMTGVGLYHNYLQLVCRIHNPINQTVSTTDVPYPQLMYRISTTDVPYTQLMHAIYN